MLMIIIYCYFLSGLAKKVQTVCLPLSAECPGTQVSIAPFPLCGGKYTPGPPVERSESGYPIFSPAVYFSRGTLPTKKRNGTSWHQAGGPRIYRDLVRVPSCAGNLRKRREGFRCLDVPRFRFAARTDSGQRNDEPVDWPAEPKLYLQNWFRFAPGSQSELLSYHKSSNLGFGPN